MTWMLFLPYLVVVGAPVRIEVPHLVRVLTELPETEPLLLDDVEANIRPISDSVQWSTEGLESRPAGLSHDLGERSRRMTTGVLQSWSASFFGVRMRPVARCSQTPFGPSVNVANPFCKLLQHVLCICYDSRLKSCNSCCENDKTCGGPGRPCSNVYCRFTLRNMV